ncbi:MAG TPA: HD domain-containing phosphohydrolase [Anaerolineales bacterium]|nr:HD domain-containing phosphohydrolase [Anaerolineales bacterium]
MAKSPKPPIKASLLLQVRQAYRALPELDPVLLSVLKSLLTKIRAEGLSLWLLREASAELECTHTAGPQAAKLLGGVMRAKKFVSKYRSLAAQNKNLDEVPPAAWMESRVRLEYFDLEAERLILAPLVARGDLIGLLIGVRKAGEAPFKRTDRDLVNALAADIATAIQNTQLYERHDRIRERQTLLNQISQHLHQTIELDQLIPNIFADVNKAIQAEAQSIWLVDEEAGIIKCHFATGPEAETLRGFAVSLSATSIVGTSVSRKESIIIKDAQRDKRRARSADEWTGFVTRSLMTVPLVLKDKSIGAIQAVNKRGRRPFFNQEDLDLFRAIADSAALAVNNAQLLAELQNSYDLTLDALSAALDLRDRETEGHSRRVVEYTARLAEQIGLDRETIKNIRRGALIHDIGKIGVPDAVLHKPSSLDEEETKIIRRHPEAGYKMLSGIPYLREEVQIVLGHQEKWDGSGYPYGLRGEEIPLGARLFMIADTFDALTSNRPYRQGRSYEIARQLIEEEAGHQFDPQAVAAFLAVPPEEWVQIRARVMDEIELRRNPPPKIIPVKEILERS